MPMPSPVPFEIAVPADALDDLVLRLRRTRYADDFGNDDWTFGVPRSYLSGIVDHWIERFDWRAQERAMNGYANFLVEIDGIPIHFVHERGRGPAPHAVDPHPRVAVDLLGLRAPHRTALGSGAIRWGPERRLRRGRAVTPGHRVLESVAYHRHRGRDDRRPVAAADARRPGLRPLRRRWWRLRRVRQRAAGPRARRPRDRRPPELPGHGVDGRARRDRS